MSSKAKKTETKKVPGKSRKKAPLERSLTSQQDAKVEAAFDKLCEDPDHGLTAGELSQVREGLGFGLDLKASAAAVDAFSPKGMSLKSLKIYAAQQYAEVSARAELVKAFKLFDKAGRGKITRRSLRETSVELGEKISDDTLTEMVKVVDLDHKGYITETEFVDFMVSVWHGR